MTRESLIEQLYQYSDFERAAVESSVPMVHPYYTLLENTCARDERGYYLVFYPKDPISSEKLFDNTLATLVYSPHQDFVILMKHTRFFREPLGFANFIAIRFVYSGTSIIHTPDDDIELHANDLLLMNENFVNGQELQHADDMVFTIIFQREYVKENILSRLDGDDVITRFMVDFIMHNKNPQNYILFHGNENPVFRNVFEQLLLEYLNPTRYGKKLIENYVMILLIQMLYCEYEFSNEYSMKASFEINSILAYITANYKTVTLKSLSDAFGYQEKYLSRKIKEATGTNFKELVKQKRMEQIKKLLVNTDLSISEILTENGVSNETEFYKEFFSQFGVTPHQYRKQQK